MHLCFSVCLTHGELVVDLVDVLVDPAMMQQAMEKVVPGIFDNSTAEALSQNIRPEGERKRCGIFTLVLIQDRLNKRSMKVYGQKNSDLNKLMCEGVHYPFNT